MAFSTITWNAGTSGDWSNAADWGGGVVPNGSSYAVLLSGSTSYTVTVASGETEVIASSGGTTNQVGLTLNDSNAVLDIAGSLTVGQSSSKGATKITAGTLEIESGGVFTQAGTSALTVNGGTVLDAGTIILTGQLGETTGSSIVLTGRTLDLQGSASSGANAPTVDMGSASQHSTLKWDSTTYTGLPNLTLNDFWQDDTLDIDTSGTVTSASATYSNGVLTIVDNAGTLGSIALTGSSTDYAAATFSVSIQNGYLQITDNISCFLRGTRITTLRGDVPVERLSIGDVVVTADGGALPIKWIGTRGYRMSMVEQDDRTKVLPIRIAAGALGDTIPTRDLYVSPEHLMCIDDLLVPAAKLLNGSTITRASTIEVVEYFHIELTRHAVLLAEGAPAESYRDTGNRNQFANVLSYAALGYDLDAAPKTPCLPVVLEDEALAAVRAAIAGRAAHTATPERLSA